MMNVKGLFILFLTFMIFPSAVYAPPPPMFGGSGGLISDQLGPQAPRKSQAKNKRFYSNTGISVEIPQGWKLEKEEKTELVINGPKKDGLILTINLNKYDSKLPQEDSLKAYRVNVSQEVSAGSLIESRDQNIDGILGVLRIESALGNDQNKRHITWMGYKNQVAIYVVLGCSRDSFESYQDLLLAVISSLQFEF